MSREIEYQPGLDGLRGVAVIAVLLFHGNFGWMSGGYLGVSVFFTLSGFLITTLLLKERSRTGATDLGGFYSRRIRRLLPASCVCLVGVIVAGAAGVFDGVANLRRDVTTSALQVANWGELTTGRSYADLFSSGVSPLAHYWSLAIEEQFYLVWPLLLLALMTVAATSRRRLTISIGGLAAVFAVAPVFIDHRWGPDAAYWATPARAGELLAGALLAAVVNGRVVPTWLRWPGVAAMALIVAAFVATPAGHGWAYHGGLPLFAILSAVVVAAAQTPGPLRTALSWRPLVATGTISYGIYLYHWPIFLALDLHLTGKARVPLFAVKIIATVAVALLSFVVIERPVRRSRPANVRDISMALAAIGVIVGTALAVTNGRPASTYAIDATKAQSVALQAPAPVTRGLAMTAPTTSAVVTAATSPLIAPVTSTSSATTSSTTSATTSSTTQAGPVRILLIGDSTALALGAGLVNWAYEHPDQAQVSVLALGGCGLVHGGNLDTFVEFARADCEHLVNDTIPAAIEQYRPDAVVVSISVSDTWRRSWDDGHHYLDATDPAYSARIRSAYQDFFTTAIADGAAHVVWLRPPVSAIYNSAGKGTDPSFINGGQQVIEDAVRSLAFEHPEVIDVLDYRSWLEQSKILDDPGARPDDMHLTVAAATRVADEWLGPELVALSRSG